MTERAIELGEGVGRDVRVLALRRKSKLLVNRRKLALKFGASSE